MGFLEEIHRRRQEAIQLELTRKAGEERQRQISARSDAERRIQEQQARERKAQGFLKDAPGLTNLLVTLRESGYIDYFQNVSQVTGFDLDMVIFTDYPRHQLLPEEGSMVLSVLKEQGSEQSRKQIVLEEGMVDALAKIGWTNLVTNTKYDWRGLETDTSKSPSTIFFGDSVETHNRGKGLSEPQEVGIGIRFRKKIKFKEHIDRRKADHYHLYLVERWDEAVYIRIPVNQDALITGATQQHTNITDLQLFDRALYHAFQKPAQARSEYWTPWYPYTPPEAQEHPSS